MSSHSRSSVDIRVVALVLIVVTKSHVDSKSAIQDVYELLMSVFPVILLGYLSTMEYILPY